MTQGRVEAAIAAMSRGEVVLVVDDEDRENEGDLIMAAAAATPEKIAFFVRHTSGLICVSMDGRRLDALGLPLMVSPVTESHQTAFTVSVDMVEGTTTGISAADRAATLRALADATVPASAFARPGHIFPLRYQEGGVLVRPGHTEAAVDLAKLAGMPPAGVLCEVVNDDGTMARGADLERFAKEHGMPLVTIEELVTYRWRTEVLVERRVETSLPTAYGTFTLVGYADLVSGDEQVALVTGDVAGERDVPVRIHSECLTGDVFASRRCDCGDQLRQAMEHVASAGRGVVIYQRGHEGRGIGLIEKLKAYRLQDEGLDTVEANLELGFPADRRHYGPAAQIIRDLGIESVRLMTNNPDKRAQVEDYGVNVSDLVPMIEWTEHNRPYLETKAAKLGHLIDFDDRD